MQTTGVESIKASAKPVIKLVAPGPDVANTTPVLPETLATYGAVSQQTVEEMAKNGRTRLNTDYCIATSGIAGPDGGTAEKPVGTVWLAWAQTGGPTLALRIQAPGDRAQVRWATVQQALAGLIPLI